ncbi:MAG TPA: FixH family protein [Vineibacter sp.]|nr:FixH family protein [Vineibacter sp.]
MRRLALAIAISVSTVPAAAQGPRHRIDLGCQPTGQALTYLCTVSIADAAGKPIDGAAPILSADMPSMPMAHSVKPVTAQAVTGKPGVYQGQMALEMLGEWAVKVQVKAPRPDVVVRKLDFQTDKVTPVAPR